ncbi:von Willebrand factor type A domain-containing protein [Chitinophaga sp. GCM10012297]|uniref:von Willebrand factor type A domain-containing protein n=1 Tax=Chitinophaga chungangae TaxID=2821488 RepID=A0ABS3YFG6_9BACT|nr:von Willebrand factor type A domain-containing protein [Chitinophaga chungangae]MBO9153420.1 von Willebrand factor type A domain-containing protein [Chitinophaga chungangae]
MKKLLLFLLAAFPVLMACAQNKTEKTITGQVVSATDQLPVPGARVVFAGTRFTAVTDSAGSFSFKSKMDSVTIHVLFIGYMPLQQRVSMNASNIRMELRETQEALKDVVVAGYGKPKKDKTVSEKDFKFPPLANDAEVKMEEVVAAGVVSPPPGAVYCFVEAPNTNEFSSISENKFHTVQNEPLSTFSADVDRASYTIVRRALANGELPYAEAVRVEELINYFDYNYAPPQDQHPVAIHTDLAVCPWNKSHQLVRIGIQGKRIPTGNLPPSNLVFLLDVSGSMDEENKLPLVKQAFKLLVQQLRPQDRVSIVVYAGAAGTVLPSTPGNQKSRIIAALNKLEAGGSTAGGEGIQLAYRIARQHFISEGNNRVILATDGDFNVGISSDRELEKLVEKEKQHGVFLSVLGFGMGNYKDNHLETLADKGNGNYAYIDDYEEARRTFATEFGGTLFTIAKDVKLQVEFNPAQVKGYRLIGYENRMLNKEDFNDDKKDAGDMGSGHTVTALYEIVPAGAKMPEGGSVDPLKYQRNTPPPAPLAPNREVLTVKLRYKTPQGNKSMLLQQVLQPGAKDISACPADFRLAASVAQFGMLLRNSPHAGKSRYEDAIGLAVSAKGEDPEGYRAEYIQLLKKAKAISESVAKED